MSEPTNGGVTVKVLTGRNAADLLKYRDQLKEGQDPHLFTASRHCSHAVSAQIAEFKATRMKYGTDGARRATKAKYESVDPETGLHASGKPGTHVKVHTGGRWRKRPVANGETPTHLRIEPDELTADVKQSEATHTIVAFSGELVNPDDPEALHRAFDAVVAERAEHYPGLQESLWLERNGESGLAHIHIASNATIYSDFTLDGVDYTAGSKMGGALTRVDDVRARFEQYLDDHPEHGLKQSLARVGTAEYEAAQRRDGQSSYWQAKRAEREGQQSKETNQDRIRREAYEVLTADGVTDRDSFVSEMRSRGIIVDETGLRRGKRSSGYDLRYTLDGAKQGVKGATLGPEYAHDAIDTQLARRSAGLDVEMPDGRQRAGAMKPLPLTSQHLSDEEQVELGNLEADINSMATEERHQQQAADRMESARLRDEQRRQAREELTAQADAYRQEQLRILDSPPARFAQLSEDELAQLIEEKVSVYAGASTYDGTPVRRMDAAGLYGEMESDEVRFLQAKWQALDEPETARERGETPEEVVWAKVLATPAPSNSIATDQQQLGAEKVGVAEAPAAEQESVLTLQQIQPATEEDELDEDGEGQGSGEGQDGQPEEELDVAEPEPFRSRLRDVLAEQRNLTPHQRRKIEGLAQLEEDYRGREPDAQFEARVSDKQGIGGVAQDTLERRGEYMSEPFYRTLTERAAVRAEDQVARDDLNAMSDERDALRREDQFGLTHGDRINDLSYQITFARRFRKQSHEGIAAGHYEHRDYAASKQAWREGHETEQRQQRVAELEPTETEKRLEEGRRRLTNDRSSTRSNDNDQSLG